MAYIELASQELDREFARVGITEDDLEEAVRAASTHAQTGAPTADAQSFGLMFELEPALRALRVLDHGAGIEAFLAQLQLEAPRSGILQGWSKPRSA
jgi:hypothetical protein